jgi:hypothetical protein
MRQSAILLYRNYLIFLFYRLVVMQLQDRGMGVLNAIRYLIYTVISIHFLLVLNKLVEFDLAILGIELFIVISLNSDLF